jgi:hypothetical protein
MCAFKPDLEYDNSRHHSSAVVFSLQTLIQEECSAFKLEAR